MGMKQAQGSPGEEREQLAQRPGLRKGVERTGRRAAGDPGRPGERQPRAEPLSREMRVWLPLGGGEGSDWRRDAMYRRRAGAGVGRRAPAPGTPGAAPGWGNSASSPAVSLDSDPFQNFHLGSPCSGSANPGGAREGLWRGAATPPGDPGAAPRLGQWRWVLQQLQPQLPAPAQPEGQPGARPWAPGGSRELTCDPQVLLSGPQVPSLSSGVFGHREL